MKVIFVGQRKYISAVPYLSPKHRFCLRGLGGMRYDGSSLEHVKNAYENAWDNSACTLTIYHNPNYLHHGRTIQEYSENGYDIQPVTSSGLWSGEKGMNFYYHIDNISIDIQDKIKGYLGALGYNAFIGCSVIKTNKSALHHLELFGILPSRKGINIRTWWDFEVEERFNGDEKFVEFVNRCWSSVHFWDIE